MRFVNNILCSLGKHKFEVLQEPSDMSNGSYENPFIFENDGLQACKSCNKLQQFGLHCLGLNPPSYIKVEVKDFDYLKEISNFCEDPFKLTTFDLQLIKIVCPNLYVYSQRFLTKGEQNG
jgi:hypothetical protein